MAEVIIKSTEKKVTKREWFGALRSFVEAGTPLTDKEGALAFIDNEVALLDRKKSAKKLTPAQEANESIKHRICNLLRTESKPISIPEMLAHIPDLKSPQHASALLRQLIADKLVERIEDKKATLFKWIGAEEEE